MKIKNLIVLLAIAFTLGSCRTGRINIVPPSSQTALSNFTALRVSVDSFFSAPTSTIVLYADRHQGYSDLELRVANLIAQDSLRKNHRLIINTDLILQKQIIQADLEHSQSGSINYYKFNLYGPLINHVVDSRITEEKSLFNVKQ